MRMGTNYKKMDFEEEVAKKKKIHPKRGRNHVNSKFIWAQDFRTLSAVEAQKTYPRGLSRGLKKKNIPPHFWTFRGGRKKGGKKPRKKSLRHKRRDKNLWDPDEGVRGSYGGGMVIQENRRVKKEAGHRREMWKEQLRKFQVGSCGE